MIALLLLERFVLFRGWMRPLFLSGLVLMACGGGLATVGVARQSCGPTDGPLIEVSTTDVAASLSCQTDDFASAPFRFTFVPPQSSGQTFQVGDGTVATVCSSGKCQSATKGTITIEVFDASHFKGNFDVVFSEGSRQGSFDATICTDRALVCG